MRCRTFFFRFCILHQYQYLLYICIEFNNWHSYHSIGSRPASIPTEKHFKIFFIHQLISNAELAQLLSIHNWKLDINHTRNCEEGEDSCDGQACRCLDDNIFEKTIYQEKKCPCPVNSQNVCETYHFHLSLHLSIKSRRKDWKHL